MKFVQIPHLPERAAAVIVSPDTPDSCIYALEDLHITVLRGALLPQPVAEISGHPDTQIFHAGKNIWIVSPLLFSHYRPLLPGATLIQGSTSGAGNYPQDAAYNIAWVYKHIFHNFSFTDKAALQWITGSKVQVKQGYSKCSVCIVDENSIITDDDSIAKAAAVNNIDVLKISKGSVFLGNLNYGFIGGAAGKLTRHLLAFAGDITKHSDYKDISTFCQKRRIEIYPLGTTKLTDIGSILPVYEEE